MSNRVKFVIGVVLWVVLIALGVFFGYMTISSVINGNYSRATFDLLLFLLVDSFIYKEIIKYMDRHRSDMNE